MADTDFSKFVPGFDFLQGLMKNAGSAIPGFNQWVAPTLDPEELDKRISELRTVQFWLENNARMLTATIQALEVQRMTLSTLHAMNVPMADLKDVLKTPPVPPTAPAAKPAAVAEAEPGTKADAASDAKPDAKSGDAAGPRTAGADPMQWWNALTQQFTQVASQAMKTAQTAAAASAAKTAPEATARPAAKAATQGAARKAAPARKTAARPATKPAAKRKAP